MPSPVKNKCSAASWHRMFERVPLHVMKIVEVIQRSLQRHDSQRLADAAWAQDLQYANKEISLFSINVYFCPRDVTLFTVLEVSGTLSKRRQVNVLFRFTRMKDPFFSCFSFGVVCKRKKCQGNASSQHSNSHARRAHAPEDNGVITSGSLSGPSVLASDLSGRCKRRRASVLASEGGCCVMRAPLTSANVLSTCRPLERAGFPSVRQ